MVAGRLHPHVDECGEESGEIRNSGILECLCGDGCPARPGCASAVRGNVFSLCGLDQRVPRRNQTDTMQLSGEEVFVSGSRSSGEALAQLCDFFSASAAPANFRTTAGCGHKSSPWRSAKRLAKSRAR